MKNNKVIVGQSVYLFDGEELVVTKVGRRYFYVNDTRKFDLEDLCEVKDYGFCERVFLSKEDFNNQKFRTLLSNTLYKQFGTHGYSKNLTLEQLKRIVNILNEEN